MVYIYKWYKYKILSESHLFNKCFVKKLIANNLRKKMIQMIYRSLTQSSVNWSSIELNRAFF